jgi:hypothetical protein
MTTFQMPVKKMFFFVSVLGLVMFAFSVSVAGAASPWWNLNTSVHPATIPTGGTGTIVVRAANLGNAPTSSASVISLTLPADAELVQEEIGPGEFKAASFYSFPLAVGGVDFGGFFCSAAGRTVTCSSPLPLQPYEWGEMRVKVKDTGIAPDAEYRAEVSGGGAGPVARGRVLPVGPNPPVFGVEDYALIPEEEGGGLDTRAGSHPYQLTATFNLNQTASISKAPAMPRNLAFKLPPGQIGNANALPTCSAQDFAYVAQGGTANLCPQDTVIGVAVITINPGDAFTDTYPVPLFNLEPAVGEPARFGFVLVQAPVILDTSVRSGKGEDYGVTVSTSNVSQLVNFSSSTVTFWGTPGDPSHDSARGWACIAGGHWEQVGGELPCELQKQLKPAAFLTLPTDCGAPFVSTVEGDSWTSPTTPERKFLKPFTYSLQEAFGVGLDACNQLSFSPSIVTEASTDSASSPSGFDFNLDFHDEGLTSGTGVAQSQLKNTVVTLPEGFTVNPSAGVGLGGCTVADYDRESLNSLPGEGCPNDSKLGTVDIETPLLAQKTHGSLFIAQPYENQFGSLVAIYIVAKNPETGVLVKLAGKVSPDPVTGRLTTTFENNPELPFDHFNFHFREGQQAPLISPSTCGTYTTTALLSPWSDPTATLTDTSSFTITKGFDGGACPSGGVPPFHPGIESGTINNNAGTYSPFYLHLTRTDGEQEISGFSTNLPSGLTGNLSGIPFCPDVAIAAARTKTGAEEEANPSCPAASQVGHTLVGTGVGAVLAYVPGKIYLAGPFHGAPFSLVAVTSAVVGPFDLGTVVLRFGLNIDPYTAQVSVSPTSSEPIPTIIQGIVTHVRDIRVYIDRHDFTLNPTSCDPLAIGSTLNASEGASATVTSPFQAASCANLKFAPKFTVSTSGKTSRAKGASLKVKLTYPQGPAGTYANIKRVKVDLPKQLPSRLTTLQKACTAAQFNANPAGCPAGSTIGHAKAITPLIPVPLEGPAIFVSHGGEAFPSLVIVLQGYGVTIDLVGTTFISKAGITSTTFKTVPDQPVGSFELTLPQGKNSALAANGNLCNTKLAMPTEFVAQNGAQIHQTTKVAVTGCAKHKKAHKASKHRKGGKKKK